MVEATSRGRREPRGRYGARRGGSGGPDRGPGQGRGAERPYAARPPYDTGAARAGGGPRPPAGRPRNPGDLPSPRRAAALAAVCAAALLTAGCGGSGAAAVRTASGDAADVGSPARTVAAAADALVRAGSSRVATALRTPSGGTWLTITGTGAFDYAHGRGQVVLTLPADPGGALRHKPITELFVPGALYMRDRGAGVPDGKWVRVDTTRLADGNLVTGGATEPLAAAELLRGARQVSDVGAQTLGGVAVRHYRGTADIASAAQAAAASGADPGGQGALAAAAKGFTVTAVPFDAWLDAQGRLRQLTERFTFGADGTADVPHGTAGGGAGSVTVVSTTRYEAFGTPVAVTAPSGSDIWTGKIVSSG